MAFLLLLLLAAVAIKRRNALYAPQIAPVAQEEGEEQGEEPALDDADPWDGRERDAIARVKAATAGEGTVEERWQARVLQTVWTDSAAFNVDEAQWEAERDVVAGGGNYIVRLALPLEGLTFGPRWKVNLETDEAPVADEATAELLMDPSLDSLARFYNRAEEVIAALTHHQFGGAYRLGGALLVRLQLDSALSEDAALGWAVVPEVVEEEGRLIYLVAFRWKAAGSVRAALWDVDLRDKRFRPRNLLANQVMSEGQRVVDMEVRQLELPRSGPNRTPMDLSTPPERESTPIIRALRFVASDERLREAVAMLLGAEDEGTIEHRGWRADPGDGPRHFLVAYVIERAGEEERIQWGVDADLGKITPLSPLAELAHRVLNLPAQP